MSDSSAISSDDSGRHDSDDQSLTMSGTIAGRQARPRYEATWPVPGITLSRYVLRRRIGFGGMGEVWAAWDGELAREVAIKVVRLRDAKSATVHAERLAREARALARLSDPHVVQVYDVGSYDAAGRDVHGVFIVMELVRGLTLGEWLSAAPRTTDEVVRLFIAAGRGLATAHAAGLVHRDVKPTNMFVGDDGRVRVGDFGLARATGSASSSMVAVVSGGAPGRPIVLDETLSGSLTDTGTAVGTPLYMAPEQHSGAVVDARGDQYAFCVAMYEALHRVRPFHGSLEIIARAKWSRRLAKPVVDDVPPTIAAAVWRGLSPNAADRWPAMTDLVEALEVAIRPRPRPLRLTALVGGVVAVGLVATVMTDHSDERCDRIGAATWTDSRRLGVVDHGQAVGLIDGYVADIDALQAELCAESADAHVAELQCLRRAASELDSVVAVLEEPSRTPDLSRLLDGLPDVDGCRHAAKQAGPLVDERDRHAVDAELRRLARGEVLWRSERNDEALALAEAVLDAVDSDRVPALPVKARALLLRGKSLDGLDRDGAAERALTDAYFESTSSGDAETAFEAARILTMAYAEQMRGHDAEIWLRHTEVELDKLASTPVLEARAVNARAGQAMFAGDLDRAIAEFRAGLVKCPIDDCIAGISLTLNLGAVLFRLGERAEAEALRRQALTAIEQRFGADSPATLLVRLDLVHGLVQNGRLDEADALLKVAEALVDRWLDQSHRYRALAADQRAEILLQRGDPGAAVEVLEKSWSIVDRTFPPDDLRRVSRMNDLAYAYFESGRADESLAWFAKARALTERLGPDSFEHGSLMVTSGYVRGELGDYEGALADLRESRRVLEPLFGADHPSVMQADLNEARVLMHAGRAGDALPLWELVVRRMQDQPRGERLPTGADLELAECLLALGQPKRALAIADQYEGVEVELPVQAALLDFVRARAMVASEPGRAVELARSARAGVGEGAREEIERIDAWLVKHGGDAARAR